MKYKRGLSIKKAEGKMNFSPDEIKLFRFSINCPKCGQKNYFNVWDVGLYNNQQERLEMPFWQVGWCKNRLCAGYLGKEAHKGLLVYLQDLRKNYPLLADKILEACVQECSLCNSQNINSKITIIDPKGKNMKSLYFCKKCLPQSWIRAEKRGVAIIYRALQCNRCAKVFKSVQNNLWSVVEFQKNTKKSFWIYKICKSCYREVEGFAIGENFIGLTPYVSEIGPEYRDNIKIINIKNKKNNRTTI